MGAFFSLAAPRNGYDSYGEHEQVEHLKRTHYLLNKEEVSNRFGLSFYSVQDIYQQLSKYQNIKNWLMKVFKLDNVSDEQILQTIKTRMEEAVEKDKTIRDLKYKLNMQKRESIDLAQELNLVKTRVLQNSGQVCNSETQVVIEKSKSLIFRINNSSLDCLMKCDILPDHYVYILIHVIFKTLFKSGCENLLEESWNQFQNTAENITIRNAMNSIKEPFGVVVKQVIELYQLVESLQFPKLKFLWVGLNDTEFTADKFKIVEVVNLPKTKTRMTDVKLSVLPGLIIGNSQIPDLLGNVMEIKYY